MIKVHYNTETTLVKGYYPNSINYGSIPEPFIEIEDNQQVLDRQMCVVNGFYQEYVTPDNVLLEQAKISKIAQLKANKDNALNNSIYSIDIDGEGCDFYLRTSDLAAIQARIANLSNDTATKSWGCTDGRRVELNKDAFQSLFRHINVNDETVYNVYAEKLQEIENITSDGEYFDENNNPITPLQALENINIYFD